MTDQLGLDLTVGYVPQIEGIDEAVLRQAADDVRLIRRDITEPELEHEVVCWLVGADMRLWELVQQAEEYADDADALIRGYCAAGHWAFGEEMER
jgi:hypothetical protein